MAKSRTSFKPGKSGNPGGRPAILKDVREAAQAHGEAAIAKLAKIAFDDAAPHAAQVSALNALLDRGYGKPEQMVHNEITQQFAFVLPAQAASEEQWLKQIANQPKLDS